MSIHVDPDVNLGMTDRNDNQPVSAAHNRRLAEHAVKLAAELYVAAEPGRGISVTMMSEFRRRLRLLQEELSPHGMGPKRQRQLPRAHSHLLQRY
jgi:hypothetical protein